MNEGRLELCLHQRWGTVSDSTWSKEEAEVVCRQLGYSTEGNSATACILLYLCVIGGEIAGQMPPPHISQMGNEEGQVLGSALAHTHVQFSEVQQAVYM